MRILKAFSVFFLLFSLVSCNEIGTVTQQSSTGGVNELLVATGNIKEWEGEIGDSIRSNFKREMYLLPIPELQFKLVNIHKSAITKKIFKKHHNIFIVDIDPKYKNAYVESRSDLWATPQVVIKINAPNYHEFLISFEEIKENAFDLFIENERARISNSYSNKFKNTNISVDLKKHFHLDMSIPKGYSVAVIDDAKAWIRKETAANSMNILVHVQDYVSVDDFNHERIKQRRNKFTRVLVPGSVPGSFQTISDEYLEPLSKEISFNDLFAVEMRGLWRVENDFMGGPFISYTFVDEKRKKLITIDGFMYAPKQKKAILMRELESILWSLKVLD